MLALSLYAIFFFVLIGLALSLLILSARHRLVDTSDRLISINGVDELTKHVKGGQTLLAALSAEGIAIPSPCGGKATCKQCKVQVASGGGEPLETDRATFSVKELRDGWRLSCQCKVKDDMALHLPENLLTLREFEAEVVSNENVATFIKELVLKIPEPIKYQPGDYLQFHVPPYSTATDDWKATMDERYFADWEKYGLFHQVIDFSHLADDEVVRAYSMASHPLEGNLLKFNIRIASPPKAKLPWGICSSYTFGLKPGDRMKLSGPFGESHMIHDDRELVFLIGGAGSSFGRSHILDLFENQKTERRVTLWYGARSLKENIYQEDFERLDGAHENFGYRLVLSEPLDGDIQVGWPVDDPVKTNYLYRAFEMGQLQQMEEPENALYFVCGPPMHNKSVLKLLDEYGVPRENIVLDDFGS